MSAVMRAVIRAIVEQHGLLAVFDDPARHPAVHLRLENAPYQPLVIERLFGPDHGCQIVSVCHYSTLNGDAMRDPEMAFGFRTWEPLYFRNDWIGIEHYVYTDPTRRRHYPRVRRELADQAARWARNLHAQGFTLVGAVQAESSSHPRRLPGWAKEAAHANPD